MGDLSIFGYTTSMSHAIYQTPAVILQARNYQESNKLLIMYTRDFGLLYIAAQSLRSAHSKMKYHTLVYSLVDIDVVRGKDLWRLTGIHQRVSSLSFVEKEWYPLLEKLASLLVRLIPGEEPHPEVWYELGRLYMLIEQDSFHESIEYIIITRILHHLGYWSGSEPIIHDEEPYTEARYQWVEEHKRELVKKINQGLTDSQL